MMRNKAFMALMTIMMAAMALTGCSGEGYCMTDAHSGRILLTWANYTAN